MQQIVTRQHTSRLAWSGVLLGGAGLFIFNVVFGPIAIGLGLTALRRGAGARAAGAGAGGPGAAGAGAADRAAAVISVVLGVADLAVLAVLVLGSATHGGVTWRFGS
jgi:hypothetical protein